MKRMRLIVPFVISIFLVVMLAGFLSGKPAPAPRFLPVDAQPTGPFRYMDYGWGDPVPIRDGKFWFWTVSASTNRDFHQYLYDLKKRRVAGELINGTPIFANRDQTRMLCEGPSTTSLLRWKFIRFLEKIPLTKGLSQWISNEEAFWILDLRDNSAVKVGRVYQNQGFGSRFVPSPDFRQGYNKPSGSFNAPEVFLCDVESNRFTKIKFDGQPLGWWDEQNILFRDNFDKGFSLFNVTTSRTNNILTAAAISNNLQQLNLPDDTTDITGLCHWNGREYDVLLTKGSEKDWGQCFLVKVDRKDLSFKLLERNFKFQWGGHFDADLTYYVYQGESSGPGKGGNGGVYLRNLTNNTTVTLVEPDNGGQYSLARFCDDGVIYWRKKHLWRIDLNGSNNAPLIPGSPK